MQPTPVATISETSAEGFNGKHHMRIIAHFGLVVTCIEKGAAKVCSHLAPRPICERCI